MTYHEFPNYTILKFNLKAFNTTNRVLPVEGKSSVCAISMIYRNMILIIFMISLGQLLLLYIANTSRTHAQTHACMHAHTRAHTRTHQPTTIADQIVAVRWVGASNHDEINAPFSPVPLAMNGRSLLHSNKQSRMRRGFRDSFGCLSLLKNSRPN